MDNSDDENVVTSAELYQSDIRLDPNLGGKKICS